jgi:TonB family protein
MRKRRSNTTVAALAAIATLSLPASAQSPNPSAAPTQTSPPTPPPASVLGQMPPTCDPYLLPGVTVSPTTPSTYFSYRFAADGSIHDVALYRSSGNSDLDKAALACANATGRSAPIMRGGNPIEGTWVGAVSWSERWHQFIRPDRITGIIPPCYLHCPRVAVRMHEEGTARVSYRITATGDVSNATIVKSTGYGALDQASLDCVSGWHYYPVTQNGVPVEVEQVMNVAWRLH